MRSRSLTARAIITVAVATSVAASALTATAPALGQAPAASPDVPAAPSTEVAAPVPSPSSSASPATSAASGDGLILFAQLNLIDETDEGTSGRCTTFHTIRPDGSDEQTLNTDCLVEGQASWGPTRWSSTGDGAIIDSTIPETGGTQVSEIAADGGSPRVLLTLPGGSEPRFSPDGTQMAYMGDGDTPATYGIFIAAADGTHPRQLVSLPPDNDEARDPRFSPDGSRLVFDRYSGNGSDVWMVNTDGTNLHQLTDVVRSRHARWSPDGSHLLFEGLASGFTAMREERDVWAIDADGTGLTRITSQGITPWDQYAAWSPDGSRIVFTYIDPGTGVRSLRVTNTDGSGVTTLLSATEGQRFVFQSPDWGPPRTDVP